MSKRRFGNLAVPAGSGRRGRLIHASSIGILLALTGASVSPVMADRVTRRDGNDFWHRLDIRRVVHSHGGDEGRVRHKLVTHERWRARVLRREGWRVGFSIRIDKNHLEAKRRIVVRRRGGKLHATFFAGRHANEVTDERVRAWRRDRRSVTVSFFPDILREGVTTYRWWGGVCRGGPPGGICTGSCEDGAPAAGSVRHVLK